MTWILTVFGPVWMVLRTWPPAAKVWDSQCTVRGRLTR
jgi:hypothetical protein